MAAISPLRVPRFFLNSSLRLAIVAFSSWYNFLFSFQLLMRRAINIPMTTRIISPRAYSKYLLILFSPSKRNRMVRKNLNRTRGVGFSKDMIFIQLENKKWPTHLHWPLRNYLGPLLFFYFWLFGKWGYTKCRIHLGRVIERTPA